METTKFPNPRPSILHQLGFRAWIAESNFRETDGFRNTFRGALISKAILKESA